MLVIRMQRTGRKGHAQFRVVVQDSRRTPTSGKIVAALGHFNPHTKETSLDKEKASFYLEHGAQPSERVARLLKSEGVKLPKWVELPAKKSGEVKNVEKRRSTRPAVAEPVEAPVEPEAPAEEPAVETPVSEESETTKDEKVAEASEATAAEPTSEDAEEVETTEPEVETDVAVEAEPAAEPEAETEKA